MLIYLLIRRYKKRKAEKAFREWEDRMRHPKTYGDMMRSAYWGYLDHLGGTK